MHAQPAHRPPTVRAARLAREAERRAALKVSPPAPEACRIEHGEYCDGPECACRALAWSADQ